MSRSAIGIRLPLATYESIKNDLPEATLYRTLSYQKHDGFIELYYLLDTEIYSDAQLKWYGDIKVRIAKRLSGVEFDFVDFDKEVKVQSLSGEVFTLKSLSDIWRNVSWYKYANDDEFVKVPKLVPLAVGGKPHENLYKTLCIYSKRLYYEKLFVYEYLARASKMYSKGMGLLPKEVRKITLKAYQYISEQIELNPEDFKQRLTKEELAKVKSTHGKRLQKYNKMRRDNNLELISEAIATGRYYKADNITLNKSAIAIATGLNRKTVEKILLLP